MTRIRARGEDVRRFVLDQIGSESHDVSKATAENFKITRQAVNKHLRRLINEGAIQRTGKTRAIEYRLAPQSEWQRVYAIEVGLAEDVVWTRDIRAVLGALPDNVLAIWHYGFTEMLNNAIDHSVGTRVFVQVRKTATTTEIVITDDGVGIFKKIQAAFGLLDERHSVLELAKGKLTTDPSRHTGEGIFFASRMFDSFVILSGGVHFSHEFESAEDWILENEATSSGTWVRMKLNNHTARTTKLIFDQYASGDDYGFTKTVVPVRLAQYGDDQLISRSQAKRLLTRVELFKTVILNFKGVEMIGQAFADEIFRVFALRHPEIRLVPIETSPEVEKMIERAVRGGNS